MAFPPKDSDDKKKSPPPFMKNGPMTPVAKGNTVFKPGQNAGKLLFNDSSKKSAAPAMKKASSKDKDKDKDKSKKMCPTCTKKGASSCSHL